MWSPGLLATSMFISSSPRHTLPGFNLRLLHRRVFRQSRLLVRTTDPSAARSHAEPGARRAAIALGNTCFFLSSLFWGWLAERIGRRWAIMIPAALGVPTAFIYLLAQDYSWIVLGFALQGMFACGGMHLPSRGSCV